METTEKIVKSCCRYGKGWSTISHTKCLGQYEIDLLAVQAYPDEGPKSCHIENGISISGACSMKCFSFWKDVKGAEVNGYSRFLLNLNRIDSLSMVGISFLSLTPLNQCHIHDFKS